jgi:hypothetical protein
VPGERGARIGLLPGSGQPARPVGAQGLKHQVAGPAIATGAGRHDQRAVDQVEHRRPGAGPGDQLGGLQRERAREHRNPAEHPPLFHAQQLMAQGALRRHAALDRIPRRPEHDEEAVAFGPHLPPTSAGAYVVYLGFVLWAVVGSAIKLVAYRRGLSPSS